MTYQIICTISFIASFLGLILLCEFLYRKYNLPVEITRKLAHIFSSLFSLIFLFTFQSYWYVMLLGAIFFTILLIGKFFNIFKSIESVQRKTAGSYLLPISICLLFLFSKENNNNLFFILPILILGISDPLAGIFGTIYKDKAKQIIIFNYKLNKTFIGSIVFAISSFIISIIVLYSFSFSGNQLVLLSLLITCMATFVEILSSNGTDNITVPHAVLLVLYFSTYY